MASKSELDRLTTIYIDAAAAHAASISRADPIEICTALRATFVAEAAMLRACPSPFDRAAADAVDFEIEDLDVEIARLASGKVSAQWSGLRPAAPPLTLIR
jgi:hypothetical protein